MALASAAKSLLPDELYPTEAVPRVMPLAALAPPPTPLPYQPVAPAQLPVTKTLSGYDEAAVPLSPTPIPPPPPPPGGATPILPPPPSQLPTGGPTPIIPPPPTGGGFTPVLPPPERLPTAPAPLTSPFRGPMPIEKLAPPPSPVSALFPDPNATKALSLGLDPTKSLGPQLLDQFGVARPAGGETVAVPGVTSTPSGILQKPVAAPVSTPAAPAPAPTKPGGLFGGIIEQVLSGKKPGATGTGTPATPGLPPLPPPQPPPPSGISVGGGGTIPLGEKPLPPPKQVGPGGTIIEPPVPPGAGGGDTGPLTDFGPGNDLRFTQINPTIDRRTARLSDLADQAAGRVGQGPDLTHAALDTLANLEAQTQRDRTAGTRTVAENAARLGRLGSGMVTTDLGNLEDLLQQRKLETERGLAADITQQEAADRRANAGTLAGIQGEAAAQGEGQRNELRGERGYEYGVGRDALSDIYNRVLTEEELKNSAFGRNLSTAELALQGAGQYDQQADQSASAGADLAQLIAYLNAYGTLPPGFGKKPSSTSTDASGVQSG